MELKLSFYSFKLNDKIVLEIAQNNELKGFKHFRMGKQDEPQVILTVAKYGLMSITEI